MYIIETPDNRADRPSWYLLRPDGTYLRFDQPEPLIDVYLNTPGVTTLVCISNRPWP